MKNKKKSLTKRINQLIENLSLGKTFTTFYADKCPIEHKKKRQTPSTSKKSKT